MTFNLTTILVFATAALLYAALLPQNWRPWALLLGSLVAIYWLQPFLFVRFASFIFPTLVVVISVAVWWLTRPPEAPRWPASDDWLTLAMAAVVILALSLFRYVDPNWNLLAARPPNPLWVALGLAGAGGAIAAAGRLAHGQEQRLAVIGFSAITLLFIFLKTEPLATAVGRFWRSLAAQDMAQASPLDLGWLGFSYVAFRWLHTLRDRQIGLLPALSLREYLSYIVFAPAYTAGPIDRVERFAADFRTLPSLVGLDAARFAAAGGRIASGLFKKFVIADALALGLALNPTNAAQVTSTAGLWLLLYGYSFRLFFDFAGYSDIAIGLGLLFGIKLPENFDNPYVRPNLTRFWQSWHITLSDWARFYVFTPLSRALLRRKTWRPPTPLIILTAQLATMSVIGLWHGVTASFLIWGLWHGLGLFIHKQWSDRTRRWQRSLRERPLARRLWTFLAWLLTFHFVVLGWVWFLMPNVAGALSIFGRLFGAGG